MTPVHCPTCASPLDLPDAAPAHHETSCAQCRTAVEVEVFPAWHRVLDAGRSGVASLEHEASCFFHAEKRAEVACDQCGRYICALCEIRVGTRALCPACFEGGARGGGATQAVRFRLLYAHLGVAVAFASLSLGVLAFLGAPFAISLGVFGLIKRSSLTGRRTIVAAVVAIVLGLLEFLPIAAFWGGVFSGQEFFR